jgi:hypothetical protein
MEACLPTIRKLEDTAFRQQILPQALPIELVDRI